jgi:hypothetical protein
MADKKDNILGGAAGKAESALKSRGEQLKEQERKAMGEPSPVERPPMSKKWIEK